MNPFSLVHWVVCPLFDLWWPLTLLSIGLSVLFMAFDDHFLFCPLRCLSFSLWPLITPLSFVHWVVCPSLYDLWWTLSLLSIALSVLLFMASDDTSLFCLLGCLSFFSLWPLMTPFSLVHWVVCPSLYGLWWPLSLLSIGLSALLLFMASDDPSLFCPLGFLSFSLWPLMNPFSFFHWVVCPSLYGLWWHLSLLSIRLSVLLFMASDEPFLFCLLGCPSFFPLWPLMTTFSFVHWVVCPSSLYGLWWTLSLLSIGLSVLLFMASDEPFLFSPLGCLSFSLWPLMTPFSFVHWVVCPSLYDLLWPFLFCPLRFLSFFLWPLMTPFSLVHWVVCPPLYDLWWPLSLWSIGLSVLYGLWWPFLFCPLDCLSFSLWPLMTPFSFVHWVVCPSLYGLWWPLSLWSIGLSVLLFMAPDDHFLFCPLGCLSFSLWPLITPLSFVHWVVCPSLYDHPSLFCPLGCLSFSLWPLMTPISFVYWVVCPPLYDIWWPLSLLSIGLSVLLFMASDDLFLFGPLGCLSFSLSPLMTPFSFVHCVVCPSLYDLWWPLSLWSIGLSVLLFMTSDDPFLFGPLGCLSSLWTLMTLSLLSIGLSGLVLFMVSDDPFLFCPLGCLSFSLWPLMTPFSLVHWVICPSLYGLWWSLSLLSIGLSVLLFMASDNPLSFVHWVVCPSLYGLWWHLSLLSIGLSVLLFMTSDDPFLFCPLGCLFFSLWPLMTPFSLVHWVVCPSLYHLWWCLSLLSIGLSVLLFMTSDEPFLFCSLGCLSFFLWPLMTPFSFVHLVVCPSLYGLWWAFSLWSIGLSVLLFMASDDPFLFCPMGCLPFFSLWPLMTPFSFFHWVVCPSSLYGLWWALSLLSIGLSVLFMASYDPFLFCPLGCLPFFSLWPLMIPFFFCPLGFLSFFSLCPLMSPFSFVHWVVCPSSLYDLWWWALSLLSIGLSVPLLFMTSDNPFVFCSLGCLSFSLWPLMTPLPFLHWVVCPSSLYGLWWPLSLLSIGLSVLLFMTSDEPFLFCSLGCLSFFFLWPLMKPFSFLHWVVCPSSLYCLWWTLSLLSIGLSVLLLFVATDEPFLFCPLGYLPFFSLWPLMTPLSLSIGLSVLFITSEDSFLFCPLGFLSFSLWPLMTPFSFVHWVICPSSLYGLWWPLSLLSIGLSALLLFMASDDPFLFCPLGCLSFSLWPLMSPFSFVHWVVSFSLWPLMSHFSFVHWVFCPSSFYGLWWNLSLFSIGLSVLLPFMASDEPFLFCPLGCLSFFSLLPLMNPFSFVHWDICPSSLYGLWWPLSLCPLGCLSSLWPLKTPFSFVHWVFCPSLYGLWWPLSLLSIGLAGLLLFMAADDPFLFCPLGCLSFSLWPLMSPFSFVHWVVSFSLWPLMSPFSFVHWVVCPSSFYGLWWNLSLLSIGLSVLLLFMASDEPFLFCPLGCLSFFSLWPLMTPFSFVHWVVCPSSFYGLWWPISLLSIGLSALLLFMASDDPFLFCPLGCLSFSLWPLMSPFSFVHWVVSFSLCPQMIPFSFVHWVVCPSSFYGLWWNLSLLSIGLSVLLLFMASDEPFLFCPLGCLSFFTLWPLMTPFSFVHWVVCPSSFYGLWWPLSLLSIGLSVLLLYGLWWPLSLLSIGLSVLLLFMASDDPFLFCPLGCLSFFSLWPLMSPFSFVHWVVCPSLYGLRWALSLLSIGLSVLLLFMASDEPFLFCPLGCLSFFSLWPLMTPFSFVHWVVCPSSLYGLWWPLSLLSIGLSVLLLFMASDDPFLFCPLGCLPFFSLWPLMTPFSFVHWLSALLLFMTSDEPFLFCPLVVCPSSFSVLLFMASDDPFLFCPMGCLPFFSLSLLWPLMSVLLFMASDDPFSFVHWVVCPSSLYGLLWPFLSFCPLGCLPFFSLWPLMTCPFSLSPLDPFLVVCLYGLWWTLFLCPLGCLSFFSLWPLMMSPFSFDSFLFGPLGCPSGPLCLFSIGLSVLLFMASDDHFLFFPLGCLSFSLWPLMTLSLLSIGLSALLLFMASDDTFLFCPLGCLSFSLWPLMTPFSLVHWVIFPSLYGLWWPLSLWSIGLSVLLFMTSDDPVLFCPLDCLSFSLWPLMTPFSFVHWVVCPSLYYLWWPLSLLSIGLSALLLFITSDDAFLFCPLGCLSFSLWPLMSPFSFVHWVVCPSFYGLWWHLSLLSIVLSVLLFMASDDPFLFGPLGCLSFSLWPLMTPLSFVHWVVCPLYGLLWPLPLLSIGLSALLLFMASDEPFFFCPLGCLSFFSLWRLMSPFSFVHWVVCPSSLYDLWWWALSLLSIGLSVLLFMTSDNLFLFCPLGCLSFSLWPLMTPFSFLHWVVCPSSLYGLWWPLSLLSIGFSVLLLFMASDDPFLFCSLGCLPFFSLWPLMTHFVFVHWVVCPSLYGLWWALSLFSIGLSVLLFMTSDEPFLFCSLGCLSFFFLWPLMKPFSFLHWVVCPSSLYGLWWTLSLLSIGLSVLLLFMATDEQFLSCPLGYLPFFSLWHLMTPLSLSIGLSVLFMTSEDSFLFCPLGCLSFSLWPLMSPFSFVHWVVSFSLWPLMSPSLLFIGLSVLLSMASHDPFFFCPLGCLSFFSLWPLMTPFSFVHWVVCPSSLYDLWWRLFLWSLGCLSSLWPLMTPFSFVHWVVCPSSLYDLWWPLSLLSIGLSVLLCMASDEPFLFGPLGCLSFSLWPLMTPFSFCPLGCLSFLSLWPLMTPIPFVHWVVCPYLYGLWWTLSLLSIGLSVLLLFMNSDDPFLFYPLGCLSFFSLWPLMTPFSFVRWVFCPSSLCDLWWRLSLWSIGLSVLLCMTSDDPSLFGPLGCLSFSLWPLMTPFSFVHWVVCPSLYGLWWAHSLLSIGFSVLLLFMTSDDTFLFYPLGYLSFSSLWPLITFSVLLFMTSDDPSLFCRLGFLSFFSLWPLMTPFSLVHWVVCPSLYDLWWPFLFCLLGCLSFFSLWPLMTPLSFVHWVVCPSLYGLWWPLSLLSIGLSVLLLFLASEDPYLFCPFGCLSFSLWPLMTLFSLVHWVVCPSLYGLWWPLSLFSIALSVLLLFMALMTPLSFVHWVVCPLYGLLWPLSFLSFGLSAPLLFMASDEPFFFCPLGCLSFFSLLPLMMSPFSFVHRVVCPSSLHDLW